MKRTNEVVVVGGGIIGASIAFELARHGMTDVVVVDKGQGPGEGSTGASSSISRCRYSLGDVARLAHDGQKIYRNWAAYTGLESPRSGLVSIGVVWMLAENVSEVTGWVANLGAKGIAAEALDADGLSESFPMLSPCATPLDFSGDHEHECAAGVAYLYEPTGGYADPVGANHDLLEAARGRGVEVAFGSEVVSLITTGSSVSGVVLANGAEIGAGMVINATGPWCNQLNAMADWDHRWTLTATRIQTVYRSLPAGFGALPVCVDSSTGIYFRSDGEGRPVLVGSVRAEDETDDVTDPDTFRQVPDPAFTERMLASLHHRVPTLDPRGQISGLAGLYTINRQDVHPIVGPTGIDGYWIANGFSGHGFKLAPAIGSMLAQVLTGETREFDTDVPMELFAADRDPLDIAVKTVLA